MEAILEREPILKGVAHWCRDGIFEIRAWCPHCSRYHLHALPVDRAAELRPGAVIGHWASHCDSQKSPCYNKGYSIEITEVIE